MFMEYKYTGGLGTYQVRTQDTDITFRLVRQEQAITGYYAFQNGEWQRFGRVGDYLELPNICLGVSNVDLARTIDNVLVGKFEYMEISRP